MGTPPQGGMPSSQPMPQPGPTFTPVPPASAASVPPPNAVAPGTQGGNQQAIAAALSMVSEDQRVRLSCLVDKVLYLVLIAVGGM